MFQTYYRHFADFDGRNIPLVYAPVILPRMVRKRTVKPANYERARKKFAGLDRRITQNTLYRLFIIEGLAARVDAINRVLGERLNEEQGLAAKGEKLASLYLTFFTEVERYAGYTEALLREIATEP